MRMDRTQPVQKPEDEIEFVNGCPLCEHSDPELEKELNEFAQLLFEILVADQHEEGPQANG